MFVLPPPSRHPHATALSGAPANTVLLETSNILEHPAGPQYQLSLGEGTYTLKDDLLLATPPPHPSEAPQLSNGPLANNHGPPVAGVKLSIAVVAPSKVPAPRSSFFRILTTSNARTNVPPSIQEETALRGESGMTAVEFGTTPYYEQAASFGDNNPTLAVSNAKSKKEQRSKPRSNISKSNSSFISRVVAHDSLAKRLHERAPEGMFAFANVNRSFLWLDLSSDVKVENLTKVLFTKAHTLCHDVNPFTQSNNHIDVIMGFSTSDIIWYEPLSQKYARLNKNGIINRSPVSSVQWLPFKENLFLAAHTDGSLIVYDKEKEDAEFVTEENRSEDGEDINLPQNHHATPRRLHVKKSVQSRNQRVNPVAVWKISSMKLTGIAFSPDGQLLAIVSDDGTLTVMDYMNERVVDVFRSYYGALLCVTWSPDGKYVLTGGQDDLVSIWSMTDRTLVARCVGHQSWVVDVKFDPWRCDERNYRFGSVGEDCRLLLWDFSVGMLGRPKAYSAKQRGNTPNPILTERISSAYSQEHSRSTSSLVQDTISDGDDVGHAVDPKASTAILPPVMSKDADEHPLCWLGFEEHSVITACKDGHIREWVRPTESTQ